MKLHTYYDGIEVHRDRRIVFVRFLTPHRVISTDMVDGGIRDELTHLYNHQSCEPKGHDHHHELIMRSPTVYKQMICETHGLPPSESASLGTAANMHCLAVHHAQFRDLKVVALCTGGVQSNGGRAGDPAAYYETDGRFEFVGAPWIKGTHGVVSEKCDVAQTVPAAATINTMVCINQELTHGAMVGAITMATEAKTSVLQELRVPSCYSEGLATGTGTDQIGIASQLGSNPPLTTAGKHCKLGELIAHAVREAIRETLVLQNGLTADSQRSVLAQLKRLGTDQDAFSTGVAQYLDTTVAAIFANNLPVIERDPPTVAAIAALMHVRDQFVSGILPRNCLIDILSTHGAQISTVISGRYDRYPGYHHTQSCGVITLDSAGFLDFVYRCFALGYQEKWGTV